MYWHVRITANNGKFSVNTKAGYTFIDVTKYVLAQNAFAIPV